MVNFDSINLKSFCTSKMNAAKIIREKKMGGVFPASFSDEGFIFNVNWELIQIYKIKSSSPIDK